MSHAEFMRIPRHERVSWMAFVRVENAAQEYEARREKLEKINVSLDDWMRMSPKDRDFKKQSAENVAKNA